MNLFTTTGKLHYSIDDDGYWLIARVDPGLGAYYRALLPKGSPVKAGRHDSHCTVVRGGRDVPPNDAPCHGRGLAAWGKYEGEKVEILVEPGLLVSGPYYFLRVLSHRFEEIRRELLLPLDNGAYDPPPAPYAKWFHITVGNTKD